MRAGVSEKLDHGIRRQHRAREEHERQGRNERNGSKSFATIVAELLCRGSARWQAARRCPTGAYSRRGDLATASLAMVPPAPPRLSTRICCPRAADHDCPTRRAGRIHRFARRKRHDEADAASRNKPAQRRQPENQGNHKRIVRFMSYRSDVGRDPVRNIADPQRPVVHLAVLGAALCPR